MGIKSLSPIDGRYAKGVEEIAPVFSEYGLINRRLFVEIEWLKFLINDLGLDPVDKDKIRKIDAIFENFNEKGAVEIKEIESETNHDVKAVEYYIHKKLDDSGLSHLCRWVHFACTSEDINNTAYGLMMNSGKRAVVSGLESLLGKIEDLALQYKTVPMIGRTHGQPASPTTVGKEMVNFAWRLKVETEKLAGIPVSVKMNGATGNYNAHYFVFPDIDWIDVSKRFISERLGLVPLFFTTQINPYHYIAEILHSMVRLATVMIDLDRDMWGYICLGYFRQKPKDKEVGSSTMPHKVNPIDFENAEGNLGIAVALMEHIAHKLLISRFQRDLSDSTVLRNLGICFGHFILGIKSTLRGLAKIEIDPAAIADDLESNPELLAEAIQTAMRVAKEDSPYERLKALTRGKRISRNDLLTFVQGLEKIDPNMRNRLLGLEVSQYTGLAARLVDLYFEQKSGDAG